MQGVVIAGTHSGCGKTTITLGILAALKKRGYRVQPFKTGPDFIDTGLHRLITGRISRNLDLWMCGRDYVLDCFNKHSADADIAVVEGVMGMYDGDLSTADLSAALGLPVILVVDAYGMAESAGAVVKGFASFDAEPQRHKDAVTGVFSNNIIGVIFNHVASDRHLNRLKASVRDVPVLGCLPRNLDFKIPHRHLGLVVAEENPIGSKNIDKLADAILKNVDIDALVKILPPFSLPSAMGELKWDRPLIREGHTREGATNSVKIAIAYDRAFCFYYEDNLDLMRQAGAEIVTFSPLSDSRIPDDADALYIGGGYPEMYAEQLSNNKPLMESIKEFSDKGRPVYAECGGFMYLTEGIYAFDNTFHPMVGIFPFRTKMKKGRARLGYREAVLNEDSFLGKKGTLIRGHEFHYSEIVKGPEGQRHGSAEVSGGLLQIYSVKDGSGKDVQDEGFLCKNTLGSYIHLHFGSNPATVNNFIRYCTDKKWR